MNRITNILGVLWNPRWPDGTFNITENIKNHQKNQTIIHNMLSTSFEPLVFHVQHSPFACMQPINYGLVQMKQKLICFVTKQRFNNISSNLWELVQYKWRGRLNLSNSGTIVDASIWTRFQQTVDELYVKWISPILLWSALTPVLVLSKRNELSVTWLEKWINLSLLWTRQRLAWKTRFAFRCKQPIICRVLTLMTFA